MGSVVKAPIKVAKKAASESVDLVQSVIGGVTGLLAPDIDIPPPPDLTTEPTPVAPDIDDEAVRRARRASVAKQIARRGRASTILTGGEGSLG